jgi:hypothetical protein
MQLTSDNVDDHEVASYTTASNDSKRGRPQHSNLTIVAASRMNQPEPRRTMTTQSTKAKKDQIPCAPLRKKFHQGVILPAVEAAIHIMDEHEDLPQNQDCSRESAVVTGGMHVMHSGLPRQNVTITNEYNNEPYPSRYKDQGSSGDSKGLPSIVDIEAQLKKPLRRIRKLESRLNNQQMILCQRHAEILQLRMNIVKSMMSFESESKLARAELSRCLVDPEHDEAESIDERLNASWPLLSMSATSSDDTLDDLEGEQLNASWPQMAGFRRRGLDALMSSRTLCSDRSFQMHTIVEELPGEGETTSDSGSHTKSEQKSIKWSQESENDGSGSGEDSTDDVPYIETYDGKVPENSSPTTTYRDVVEPESGCLTRWNSELSDEPPSLYTYSSEFWKAAERRSDETLDTKLSSLFSEENDEGFGMCAPSDASDF